MESVKAVLIFCEGAHDAAFCRFVFRYSFGIDKVEWKFSEYPAPFNQLFRTGMEKHAQKDLSLDMAHKFFLPDRTLYSENNKMLILLFNAGGKSKMDNPANFLSDFLPMLANAKIFPNGAQKVVTDARYIFLYDADHEGPEKNFQNCQTRFAKINGMDFIPDPLERDADNPKSAFLNNTAVYIWSDGESDKGTLEDILFPMFEKDQGIIVSKSSEFIDRCFQWETNHEKDEKRIAEIAKRKKAIICCSGQRKKPGLPMNAIFKEADLISPDTFKKNSEVIRFARFICAFCDMEPEAI